METRRNVVESLDKCVWQLGRQVVLGVAGIGKTVSKYFSIPGAKPYAVNMRIVVVRTLGNEEVN